MDTADVIRLAITASMGLLVLAIGMRSTFSDALFLFRRPGLLARSLVSMNVIAPILAIWLVTMLDLRPAIRIALVALSLSPVPPILPNKQLKLVHAEGYAIGLFVLTAVCAIVTVPVIMALFQQLGYANERVKAVDVLRIVAVTALVPLLLGIGLRALWPSVAERLHVAVGIVATVVLLAAFVPVVIGEWPAMRALIGDGTLLALIVATVLWLVVGHVLGGPGQEGRSVLALATASRHPAVALAVASVSFEDHKLVAAAVLLAFLVSAIVSAPYVAWRKRLLARADHPGTPTPHGVA